MDFLRAGTGIVPQSEWFSSAQGQDSWRLKSTSDKRVNLGVDEGRVVRSYEAPEAGGGGAVLSLFSLQ